MNQPYDDPRYQAQYQPGYQPGSQPGYQPGYQPAYQPQYAPPVGGAVQPYVAPRPAPVRPHVVAPPLVSAGGRFGGLLLDALLMLVTLWIGWFVWSMFTWTTGQTPAKKILGHVVVDADTGAPFDWGRMALREFCVKGLLGWLLNAVTCSIYLWVDAFMCFGDRQRTAHDRFVNSVVRYL
jgi:uncharacterized RDD family membrane protein YckC